MLKIRLQDNTHHDAFGAFSWRRGKPSPGAARDMLVIIGKIVGRRYPYHTLFAYDIINKATKRHGTQKHNSNGLRKQVVRELEKIFRHQSLRRERRGLANPRTKKPKNLWTSFMPNALEKQTKQPLLKVRLNYADFVRVDKDLPRWHRMSSKDIFENCWATPETILQHPDHRLRIFAYDKLNQAT